MVKAEARVIFRENLLFIVCFCVLYVEVRVFYLLIVAYHSDL